MYSTINDQLHIINQISTFINKNPGLELDTSYNYCMNVMKENSKSFYFATQSLLQEKRKGVGALYAFCRTVDDIVDESTDEDRDRQLEAWKRIVQMEVAPESDLIASAWVDAVTRYHIPRHYAIQLIDGVARDLAQSRYETFDDLATYCYGVASTVGLMKGRTKPE